MDTPPTHPPRAEHDAHLDMHVLGGTMRRTVILLAACLLLAGAAVGCSKSYDEIAEDCVAALKKRSDGDKAKPEACNGLKEDDYDALLMSHILKNDLGWVDEDGNVDQNEMLEDALEGQ
ncbi:hypothetical protein [Streptomyces sp. NPDC047042]|uniref:hypothetical protein n=1 Tax=Streptomyces sp. NPDC047042 TaxID=3154807 RepID=UPI0033DA6713